MGLAPPCVCPCFFTECPSCHCLDYLYNLYGKLRASEVEVTRLEVLGFFGQHQLRAATLFNLKLAVGLAHDPAVVELAARANVIKQREPIPAALLDLPCDRTCIDAALIFAPATGCA